jgi:transposase InsO family protein
MQQLDPDIGELYEEVQAGEVKGKGSDFVMEEGILYKIASPVKRDNSHHLQLVVPKLLTLGILKMMHDNHGHLGLDKTHDLIRERYFWQNSYRDVHQYISKCMECMQRKMKALRVPIQSMPLPNMPFQTVAMDLQGPFPETENGDRYILSLVCLFSGWPEAFPIPDKSTKSVAKVLLEEFIPRHSCPERLISDQGGEFCSEVIRILSKKMKILRIRTSPYHPQANGKCERLHRVLNDIIAKRVAENQLDWPQHIPAALYAIRTSVHSSSRHTPYFLVYGRDPKLPVDTLFQPKFRYMGEEYVPTMIQRLHRAYVDVKANLRESQEHNQKCAKSDEGPKLEVGDRVLFANLSTDPGLSRKLVSHWQPYFRIIERKSPVNFVIKHLPTNTVKLVHASHLRRVPDDVEWDEEFQTPADIVSNGEQAKLQAARDGPVPDVQKCIPEVVPAVPQRRQPVRSCRLTTRLTEPSQVVLTRKRHLSAQNNGLEPDPQCPRLDPSEKQSVICKRPSDEPDMQLDSKRQRVCMVQHTPPQHSWWDTFLHLLRWK